MRSDRTQRFDRRRVLELPGLGAAGLGASGLAGCGTQQLDDRSGGNVAQKRSGHAFHDAWPYVAPPQGHDNLFTDVPDRMELGIYFDLLVAPGGLWYWSDQKWLPMICETFELERERFVYNVAEGLTWNNDDPITAQDVEATFWCRWIMREWEWDFIRDLRVTSERQVIFDLVDAANVLEYYVIRANIFPAQTYGEFAERGKELFVAGAAIDGPEVTDLNGELQRWRPKDPVDDDSRILTSGPFWYDFSSVTEK